jgi:hypothetical protein
MWYNQNPTYGNSVAAALIVLASTEADSSVTLAKVAFEVFPASITLTVEFCPEIISSLYVLHCHKLAWFPNYTVVRGVRNSAR